MVRIEHDGQLAWEIRRNQPLKCTESGSFCYSAPTVPNHAFTFSFKPQTRPMLTRHDDCQVIRGELELD